MYVNVIQVCSQQHHAENSWRRMEIGSRSRNFLEIFGTASLVHTVDDKKPCLKQGRRAGLTTQSCGLWAHTLTYIQVQGINTYIHVQAHTCAPVCAPHTYTHAPHHHVHKIQ